MGRLSALAIHSGFHQIGEDLSVVISRNEAWQLAPQPIGELDRDLVVASLHPVDDKGADEDLATCVVGALPLSEATLEGLLPGLELSDALLERPSGHDDPPHDCGRRVAQQLESAPLNLRFARLSVPALSCDHTNLLRQLMLFRYEPTASAK